MNKNIFNGSFRTFLPIILSAVILFSPTFVSADTTSDLQAQINALLTQLQTLQAKLAAQTGTTHASVGTAGDTMSSTPSLTATPFSNGATTLSWTTPGVTKVSIGYKATPNTPEVYFAPAGGYDSPSSSVFHGNGTEVEGQNATYSVYSYAVAQANGSVPVGALASVTLPYTKNTTQTTSAPVSTKFNIGDRVQTLSSLNVRSSASLSQTQTAISIIAEPAGIAGTIIDGPVSADGYIWWQVNYDNNYHGWSVENYLSTYTGATPTTSTVPTSVKLNPTALPTPIPTPAASATFNFSPNNGKLIAGKDAWSYNVYFANPGDVLSVDASKNGVSVGHFVICTVPTNSPIAAGACSASSIPGAGDVGQWTENVFVNSLQKGTVTFTVLPSTTLTPNITTYPTTQTATSNTNTTGATTQVSGTPAFYKGVNQVTSVACGDTYTFRVDGYSSSQIWLHQEKLAANGNSWAVSYDGLYTVPNTYTSICNHDEGTYSNTAYSVVNGQKGSLLGSTVVFTINPATVVTQTATTPTITVTPASLNAGDTATISWTPFAGPTSFYYEGAAGQASTILRSDVVTAMAGSLMWTVPSGTSGSWRIRAANSSGNFYSAVFTVNATPSQIITPIIYTYPATQITPTISSLAPVSVLPGGTVFVTGNNFDKTSLVKIDGSQTVVPTVSDSGTLSFVVPTSIGTGSHMIQIGQTTSSNLSGSLLFTVTAPTLSVPTYSFTPNNGTLYVAKDSWTYTLSGANIGDTLSVDASKNGSPSTRYTICTVTSGTSCTKTVMVGTGDVGAWNETVYINGVQKGAANAVNFVVTGIAPTIITSSPTTTTAPSPATVSCSLSFSSTSINVGNNIYWTVSSNPTGLSAYWYGSKTTAPGTVIDANGAFAGTTNFGQSYTYQAGDVGSYSRYLVLKDASGNSVCTTNTVNLTVSNPTAMSGGSSNLANILDALKAALNSLSRSVK